MGDYNTNGVVGAGVRVVDVEAVDGADGAEIGAPVGGESGKYSVGVGSENELKTSSSVVREREEVDVLIENGFANESEDVIADVEGAESVNVTRDDCRKHAVAGAEGDAEAGAEAGAGVEVGAVGGVGSRSRRC